MDYHVSILIPIFNGIEFIDDSVNSVINQKFKNWELLIGINGHKENSEVFKIAKKFEKYENIKVYDFYTLKSKATTLNEMLKYTKYDLIALLDVDDIWSHNKLLKQIKYIDKYDVIGTQCKYFGDLNIIPKIPLGDLKNFNFFDYNPIINSSVLLNKKFCFWNDIKGAQDYDLWIRLWLKGLKFYNLDSVEVLHRIHKNSFFNTNGNHLMGKKLIEKYKK